MDCAGEWVKEVSLTVKDLLPILRSGKLYSYNKYILIEMLTYMCKLLHVL